MGAFYGAIFVRTSHRDGVARVVDRIARRRRCRFLIAPPLAGWVAIYPCMNGQDAGLAQAICSKVEGFAVYTMVHDDDVFAYVLYRDGKRIDQFDSTPDYFETVSARKRASLRGKPEAFADLLENNGTEERLRELLSPDRTAGSAFKSQILAEFAGILRLPNACTAYEYLESGETEGVEGWGEFLHVPDRSSELAAQAAAAEQTRQRKQELRKQGKLLAELASPKAHSVPGLPIVAAHPEQRGFLIGWRTVGESPSNLAQYQPPDWSESEVAGLPAAGTLAEAVTSASGRFVALDFVGRKAATVLFDWWSKHDVASVQTRERVLRMEFMPDDSTLVVVTPNQAIVIDVTSGSKPAVCKIANCDVAAVHPSGMIAVHDPSGALSIIEPRSGEIKRQFIVHGTRTHPIFGDDIKQAKGQLEAAFAPNQGQILEAAKSTFGRISQASSGERDMWKAMMRLTDDDLQDQESLEAALLRRTEEALRQLQAGGFENVLRRLQSPPEHVHRLLCTRDGNWLCCATGHVVCAYRWSELVNGESVPPEPEWRVEAEPGSFEDPQGVKLSHANVYAVAEDAAHGRLFFGGMAGAIYAVDRATGTASQLFELPGRPVVTDAIASGDGQSLAIATRSNFFGDSLEDGETLVQVWNVAKPLANVENQ